MTLESGYSWTTLLGVMGLAAILAIIFYRKHAKVISPRRWRWLVLLRVLAIILVGLLLFRPAFSFEREVRTRRAVLFAIDGSKSMATIDDASGKSRYEQARSRLLDWWPRLQSDFDLGLVEFSDQAAILDNPSSLADHEPLGQSTSLVKALQTAAQMKPRQVTEAIVLLTDGVHNTSGDPVQQARRGGIPVHTVGVGNSLRGSSYRDIQVVGLECPEQMPIKNRTRVSASIDAIGFGGRQIKVILEEDQTVIGETELILDDVEGGQKVDFEFVPSAKGRHAYTVKVPVAPGEKITTNNQRIAFAQVIDIRIRVLYLEGTLRAEFGALVDRFLSKDPDIEFCALVQTRPNVFVQRSNIPGLALNSIPTDAETLEKFDVFLIGDLDSTYLKPAQMALLEKRVRSGGGLIMLGGYHSLGPGGYGNTPLEAILPVNLGDRNVGQITDPFLPTLTPEGRQHPIFANIARFFPSTGGEIQASGLPLLLGCVKVISAKPSASILALLPAELAGTGSPMPVLAVQPVDKGRTAVFTADTTRTWQQALRAMNQESPFLRFWGQTVRWLANRGEVIGAGLTARTDRAYYQPGTPITILATVRNAEGEGTNQATVRAAISGPNDSKIQAILNPTNNAGQYQAVFEPKGSGRFDILVEARVGDLTLKADPVVVDVGRAGLEFERLDLDERLLARIAAESGGRYHHLTTSERMIDELSRAEHRRRVLVEQPLYWAPLFWVLFVAALAGEWFLRRRSHLR